MATIVDLELVGTGSSARSTIVVGLLSIRFSPDGRTIATGDFRGNVDFWDAATGREVGTDARRTERGRLAASPTSPNGEQVMTTSTDGKFRLWDLASGKLVGSPLPGADVGGWGTFFPDGKRVIATFLSGIGVVWNVDPAAWGRQACRTAHRTLTRAEWREFVPERSFRARVRLSPYRTRGKHRGNPSGARASTRGHSVFCGPLRFADSRGRDDPRSPLVSAPDLDGEEVVHNSPGVCCARRECLRVLALESEPSPPGLYPNERERPPCRVAHTWDTQRIPSSDFGSTMRLHEGAENTS